MVLGHSHGHGGHGHGGHGHGGHGHGGSGAGEKTSEDRARRRKMKKSMENINVRAAFIHVIGDLIQSIGVVIAGYIIWIWVRQSCWGGGGAHVTWCSVLQPEAKLADPICTFLFCTLVLFSTFNILKDALRVVMEGTVHAHAHVHACTCRVPPPQALLSTLTMRRSRLISVQWKV